MVILGGSGVLVATGDGTTLVPPVRVEVCCALGAGDAFGSALDHEVEDVLAAAEEGARALV